MTSKQSKVRIAVSHDVLTELCRAHPNKTLTQIVREVLQNEARKKGDRNE